MGDLPADRTNAVENHHHNLLEIAIGE